MFIRHNCVHHFIAQERLGGTIRRSERSPFRRGPRPTHLGRIWSKAHATRPPHGRGGGGAQEEGPLERRRVAVLVGVTR